MCSFHFDSNSRGNIKSTNMSLDACQPRWSLELESELLGNKLYRECDNTGSILKRNNYELLLFISLLWM